MLIFGEKCNILRYVVFQLSDKFMLIYLEKCENQSVELKYPDLGFIPSEISRSILLR